MNIEGQLDNIKLNHWLNIRKTTVEVLNGLLKGKINFELSTDNLGQLDSFSIDKIAEVFQSHKRP